MDIWHKITKWFDHNRYEFGGYALTAIVGVATVVLPACGVFDGKVNSSITGEVSTAAEIKAGAKAQLGDLMQERTALIASLEANEADITRITADANEEIEAANLITDRNFENFNFVLGEVMNTPWAQGLLVTSGLGVLASGIGPRLDNRRKDKQIEQIKNPVESA